MDKARMTEERISGKIPVENGKIEKIKLVNADAVKAYKIMAKKARINECQSISPKKEAQMGIEIKKAM